MNKTWDFAAHVKQSMELDGRFMSSEFGPPKHVQTKFDSGRIQSIGHVVQIIDRCLPLVQFTGFGNQGVRKCFIDSIVAYFIGIRKGRSLNAIGQSQMIKLLRMCVQAGHYIAQAFPLSKLTEAHTKQLVPTRKSPYTVVSTISFDYPGEGLTVNQSHKLCKNIRSIVHIDPL